MSLFKSAISSWIKIAVRDIGEVPTFVGMTNLVGVRRFQPSLESDYLKLISPINSWQ
jgi:hypothetical protein